MAGRFLDFMAQGADADLPVAATMAAKIVPGSAAIYYANDSQKWYFYNEDTVAWDPLDLTVLTGLLSDLGDVDFSVAPTDGQMLAYDFASSKWKPMDVPAGYDDSMADARIAAASVGDLSDVDLSTPATNGQALIWDTDHFEPQSIPAGYTDEQARDAIGAALIGGTGITVTVDDGADTITVDSDITQYTDGMADARVAAGIAAASIDDLSDVDTSTTPPTDGQALVWETDKWVPGDVAGGGTAGVQWVVDATGTGASQGITLPVAVSLPQDVLVFVNGIRWKASEYSVTSTTLTITTNAAGDNVQIIGVVTDTASIVINSDWQVIFKPVDNEPPASNFATLDIRNGRPVLDFDTTTQESAIFTGVLPASYMGAGIVVTLYYMATSAITGTIGWDVAIERVDAIGLDTDIDSFATAATVTAATVPGTSGQILVTSVNIANGAAMDSLAAGEMFRLRVRRDVANDTATGDAELLAVLIKEQ